MAKHKPWSAYTRNGIWQVQFYDYENKRYRTARSTGTRDWSEALRTICRWQSELENGCSTLSYKNIDKQPQFHQRLFTESELAARVQIAVDELLHRIISDKNHLAFQAPALGSLDDVPEEIRDILDQLSTLTFYDYILLYWNYNKSPYVKSLMRKGETPPNPERFRSTEKTVKKYADYIPRCLLTEITGTKIDTMLGTIRTVGGLKNNTMKNIRGIFVQALHFAYRNNLLARDIAQQVATESKTARKKAKKEAEKAIFTKEDIQQLFNSKYNPFGSETYRLINELLFKTGCRIGELQALQMQDIVKTANGYTLNISKNYCRAGKRLKCTKTERTDSVPISADLTAKLLAHIEKSPCKDIKTAFIFSSVRNAHQPLCYENISKNFNKTMKALGIKKRNLTLHSYRHTFATFLRMAGYSEEQLLYLTRHDNPAEVHHYTNHYTPDMERLKHQAAIDIEKIAA